ncbi:MAG: 4-hydroxy-tetrahydrodipicolinate synthase [Taibaiella sp.]|nr:4-hydroxy-tetrahydrodipicolinate synthase [Taibaiella sp.]
MSHLFSGTGVALVTPFTENEAVDFNALTTLIHHVINGGVSYLVALGTTGETPTLTEQEKKEVLAHIVKVAAGRVPIVCGLGGNNTAEVVHNINTYPLQGVSGILSVAPYYNKPTQEGLYQHFRAIVTATTLPVILYNVPGRTSSNILPATALRLANEFTNVIAIKEASGNIAQCMELVQSKPAHFAVLSGDDNLVVAQIAIGMEGVISVAANCYTKDFTDMVDAALSDNYTEARRLLYQLLPGMDLLFVEGNPAGVKCVLKKMNICGNKLRLPLVPVSQGVCDKIGQYLANISA